MNKHEQKGNKEKNKLGVNDPCICGSGKKYKRCCKNNVRPKNGTLTKAYNTGTEDPFIARIIFQICKIRDCVYRERKDRRLFDEIYDSVKQNLIETKLVKEKCIDLINDHVLEVKNKKAAYSDKDLIRVDKPIDDDLNIWFKDFFIRGEMAINGLIKLTNHLGYKISFMFANEKDYKKSKKEFLEINNSDNFKSLITMVDSHRLLWYQPFNDLRNKIEHHGFKLKEIKYVISEKKVKPIFPSFKTANGFVDIKKLINPLWENIFTFCEEIIVFFMSQKLPDDLILLFVPKEYRDPSIPIKYKVIPKAITNEIPTENLYKINFSG